MMGRRRRTGNRFHLTPPLLRPHLALLVRFRGASSAIPFSDLPAADSFAGLPFALPVEIVRRMRSRIASGWYLAAALNRSKQIFAAANAALMNSSRRFLWG